MLKRKLVSPVLMWLIVILGVYFSFKLFPKAEVFPKNILASFLIFPAIAYWMYFFIGALKVHRQAARSAEKIDKIVTNGVYKIVRHPIYSADIVLACGIFFYWPLFKVLLSAVWLTIILLSWMKLEEKALEEKFGEEYRNYKNKVPMIIPIIF